MRVQVLVDISLDRLPICVSGVTADFLLKEQGVSKFNNYVN